MAKTVLSNKRSNNHRTFYEVSNIFRLLRFVFLLFISFLLVYMYYLHLTGNLQKNILAIWTNHQQVLIASAILFAYSGAIFQLGVWRGKRR